MKGPPGRGPSGPWSSGRPLSAPRGAGRRRYVGQRPRPGGGFKKRSRLRFCGSRSSP